MSVPRADSADTLRAHWPMLMLAALLTAVCVIGSRELARNADLVNWSFTHWAFSYQHGFVKRGLPGEVLSWFVAPAKTFETIEWIAVLNSTAVAVALLWVFWGPFARTRDAGALAFAVLATTHVATLQHAFYDVGRFDQIGLLLALFALTVVDRAGPRLTALLVAVVGTVGIVIHEAFVVIFVPTIMAYWAIRQPRSRTRLMTMAGVGAWYAAVTVLIAIHGRPSVSQVDYVRELISTYGPWIDERSVRALYGSAPSESMRAIRNLIGVRRVVQHLELAILLLPTAVILLRLVRRATASSGRDDTSRGIVPAVLIALSPLFLYPVGTDFARWWALALTNVFVVIALLARDGHHWRAALACVSRERTILWLAVAVSLLAGPLGVAASPFPRIEPAVVASVTAVLQFVR